MVLTINGKAELVVQDAASYQRLLDIAAQADPREGIRQGLDDISQGRTRPAREVFDALRAEYDIPRRTDGPLDSSNTSDEHGRYD